MANVVETVFRGVDQITNAVAGIDSKLGALGRTAASAGKLIAAGFIADKILEFGRAVIKMSDDMQEMNEVLMQVTDSSIDFLRVQHQIAEVAVQTDTAYKSTFETFARLSQINDQLRMTEAERLNVVRTLNQAMQVAGPLAADVSQAFNRMLATGNVEGRGFVQLVAGAPRLARALMDELGAQTTEQLKRMADQGQLTLDVFVRALNNQSAAIQKDFEKTGTTVAESLTDLGTATGQVLQRLNEKFSFTERLARGILATANDIMDFARPRNESDSEEDLASAIDRTNHAKEMLAAELKKMGLESSLDPEIDKLPLAMKKRVDSLLLGVQNATELELKLQAEKRAFEEARVAAEKNAKALADASAVVDLYSGKAGDMLLTLEHQVELLGKTADQATILKLKWEGANAAQIAAAESALRTKDAYERTMERMSNVTDAVQDGMEGPVREVEAGLDELANRSQAAWAAVGKAAQENTDKFSVSWEQAVRNMTDVLADWFSSFDEGLRGMLRSFVTTIERMVAQAAAANVMEQVFGSQAVGSSGSVPSSKFGDIVRSIFGGVMGKGLAVGGDTTPGMIHPINENEPEFLVTSGRDRVIPLSQMASAGLGGGGVFAPSYTTTVISPLTAMEVDAMMRRNNAQMMADIKRWLQDGGSQ